MEIEFSPLYKGTHNRHMIIIIILYLLNLIFHVIIHILTSTFCAVVDEEKSNQSLVEIFD